MIVPDCDFSESVNIWLIRQPWTSIWSKGGYGQQAAQRPCSCQSKNPKVTCRCVPVPRCLQDKVDVVRFAANRVSGLKWWLLTEHELNLRDGATSVGTTTHPCRDLRHLDVKLGRVQMCLCVPNLLTGFVWQVRAQEAYRLTYRWSGPHIAKVQRARVSRWMDETARGSFVDNLVVMTGAGNLGELGRYLSTGDGLCCAAGQPSIGIPVEPASHNTTTFVLDA